MACTLRGNLLLLCLLLALTGSFAQRPLMASAPTPSLGGPAGENEAGTSGATRPRVQYHDAFSGPRTRLTNVSGLHAVPVPSQMAPSTERQHVDLRDRPFHTIQVRFKFYLSSCNCHSPLQTDTVRD